MLIFHLLFLRLECTFVLAYYKRLAALVPQTTSPEDSSSATNKRPTTPVQNVPPFVGLEHFQSLPPHLPTEDYFIGTEQFQFFWQMAAAVHEGQKAYKMVSPLRDTLGNLVERLKLNLSRSRLQAFAVFRAIMSVYEKNPDSKERSHYYGWKNSFLMGKLASLTGLEPRARADTVAAKERATVSLSLKWGFDSNL